MEGSKVASGEPRGGGSLEGARKADGWGWWWLEGLKICVCWEGFVLLVLPVLFFCVDGWFSDVWNVQEKRMGLVIVRRVEKVLFVVFVFVLLGAFWCCLLCFFLPGGGGCLFGGVLAEFFSGGAEDSS